MKNKLDCLKLINFIEKSIDFKNYILPCQNILVAYSGGQDSSALLAIFYILSKKWHFNIGVVYCNHNWNRSTVASNTAFEIIMGLNLPFYYVDSKRAIKPENQARKWRYQAFATLINHSQYDLVLTGHTLSDCAETIIFNLCRGSGLKGVCSLKKFQTFPQELPPLFQFKIQLFSSDDFKTYSNKNIFRYCLSNNLFQTKPTSLFKIENWMFVCYLRKQSAKNVNQIQNLTNVDLVGIKINPLAVKNKFISPFKNKQCEQFPITFFDPMIYLFITGRFKKTKPVYFFSPYICSLFPTLQFYLANNLKVGTNCAFFSKTVFTQNRFSLQNFRLKQSNTVLFFIQQGLKNKISKVQLKALLNRKLKERKIFITSFYYYLQPTFINDFSENVSFIRSLNFRLDSLNQLSYHLHPGDFKIPRSDDFLSTNHQSYLKSKLMIYRPLICINRKVIGIFDQQLELKLIIDQSNNDVNLTRNFIRQKILPLLKQINPQVEQNLYKFSQIAAFYLDQTGDINFDSKHLNIFKP